MSDERLPERCHGCFIECERRRNQPKPFPCDKETRDWAAAHRFDPGDERGYVREGE